MQNSCALSRIKIKAFDLKNQILKLQRLEQCYKNNGLRAPLSSQNIQKNIPKEYSYRPKRASRSVSHSLCTAGPLAIRVSVQWQKVHPNSEPLSPVTPDRNGKGNLSFSLALDTIKLIIIDRTGWVRFLRALFIFARLFESLHEDSSLRTILNEQLSIVVSACRCQASNKSSGMLYRIKRRVASP